MQEITHAYQSITARTLETWAANSGVGEPLPIDFQRLHLGVSSGQNFSPTGELQKFHSELIKLAQEDSLMDVVPVQGLHFTFLALAWDHFASPEALPPEINELVPLFKAIVAGLNFRVNALRLVPLKNALLLAGIPDPQTLTTRQQLTEQLLQSSWRPYLEARYAGYPIPPLIWHVTLVRYGAEYAPWVLRDLYWRYQATMFGDLALGEPEIGAINYNWTTRILF